MQRKKGESAKRPAIFHADVYDPNPKQHEFELDRNNMPRARTENRLFKVTRRQKRDK